MGRSSYRRTTQCSSRTRSFFFFNDTATTEIYTLSLHDALPIFRERHSFFEVAGTPELCAQVTLQPVARHDVDADRKSTRLNSSHLVISYAVFCLKKQNGSTSGSRRTRSAPSASSTPFSTP